MIPVSTGGHGTRRTSPIARCLSCRRSRLFAESVHGFPACGSAFSRTNSPHPSSRPAPGLRGTSTLTASARICSGRDKQGFLVFDLCQNVEFFKAGMPAAKSRVAPSPSQRLLSRRAMSC